MELVSKLDKSKRAFRLRIEEVEEVFVVRFVEGGLSEGSNHFLVDRRNAEGAAELIDGLEEKRLEVIRLPMTLKAAAAEVVDSCVEDVITGQGTLDVSEEEVASAEEDLEVGFDVVVWDAVDVGRSGGRCGGTTGGMRGGRRCWGGWRRVDRRLFRGIGGSRSSNTHGRVCN